MLNSTRAAQRLQVPDDRALFTRDLLDGNECRAIAHVALHGRDKKMRAARSLIHRNEALRNRR